MKTVFITALSMGALVLVVPLHAQTFPSKPIRMIVAFPPGSPLDQRTRVVAQRSSPALGQPVVVENRPGGDTIVAAEYVAKSPADGYTLLATLDTTMTLLPALRTNLPYDPIKDFAPITLCTLASYVIAARADGPFRTLPQLASYAKANPGKVNMGAATAFTKLLVYLVQSSSGTDIASVPYKGSPPLLQALLGGEVQATVDGIAAYVPMIRAGKLTALATTGQQRAQQLPDVPTVVEAGFPNLVAHSFTGFYAPGQTPEAVIRRLNAEFTNVMKDEEIRKKDIEVGQNPLIPSTPEELARMVKEDLAKWTPLVRSGSIKLE